MENEIKKTLSELMALTKENNEYLRKIDRRQRYNMYWKTFVFIIAVGSALGLYYVVQPYVDQIGEIYGQMEQSFVQFGSLGNSLKGIGR
jgi:fructoselysine-6-P-deglycase FrlB-like protein